MRKFSEDRFLADLFTKDPVQANFLQRLIDSIDNVAKTAGVAMAGDLNPPPPVNAITVKARGELVHATLTHGAEVTRAIDYFIEADTSPSFTQPHVVKDGGPGRGSVFHLPTFDDNGVPQKWYLRTYAQYPGSKPSAPTVLGGVTNPTPLQMQGNTKMTLLPSTGSGTASGTGQQGGAGRGRQRVSTPKVLRVGKSQASAAPVVAPNVATHLATGSAPAIGVDPSPFSFTTTTTSITITWSSFSIYRPDGTIQALPASPAGGIAITGLTANTQYFFYPYYDELAQAITFSSGGAGSPSYAFTAANTVAAQQQNLTTNVALSSGALQITTPASGTGGGSGGGGNCFTGETRIKTPWGFVPFRDLPANPVIVNETGRWHADLVIHDKCDEPVIALGSGRVNLIHGLRWNGEWIAAGDLFRQAARKRFCGKLYNLHVKSEREEDHHYIVEPGWIAHNFLMRK